MAVDSIGPKGQPHFDGSKRGNTAADQTAISDYAGKVGNRVACTAAQMAAFNSRFGFDPWDGLECYQTDTGDTFIFNASVNGWNAAFQSGPAGGGFFTPSSGWSMTSNGGTRGTNLAAASVNGVQCYVSFFRDGASITVPADGNVKNVTVGRVAAGFVPLISSGLGSGFAGRAAQFVVGTDGYVSLVATTPNATINDDDAFSLTGFYLTN